MNNKIALLYNLREDFPQNENIHPDISADWDIPETIFLLKKGLSSTGLTVKDLRYNNKTPQFLASFDGLIFNICEMTGGSYREALIPSLCELYNLPYVFSPPEVMLNTLDKNICNYLVSKLGVNVPEWHYISASDNLSHLPKLEHYPYIIKLAHEGSGIGISNQSIVYNNKSLVEQAKLIIDTFKRPIIIQKYIDGIELTIGVIGSIKNPQPLGLVEISLIDSLVYGIKEKENSASKAIYSNYKNQKITTLINQISKKIYSGLGCRDAARIDFRLEKQTLKPYFIEINPLPHLHPVIGDFCRSAYGVNLSYDELINLIIQNAIKRIK